MRFDRARLLRVAPLFALIALLAPALAKADKAPEPSIYPVAPELDFKYNAPKRIVVDVPGDQYPRAYWYMTYTVTNNGKAPYHFEPSFEMLTDDGKILRSDKNIPSAVFDAIKKREGNKLLESARQIEGDIQTGEDLAHDGVAIWPEPMTRMGTFSIFAGGLSGEYVTLKRVNNEWVPVNPKKAGEELKGVDPKDLTTMRKTLQLTYSVLGDEVRPGNDPVVFKGRKWIMR